MKIKLYGCILIFLFSVLSGVWSIAAQESDMTYKKYENVWYAYKTISSGSETAEVIAPQDGEEYERDLYIPSYFTIGDWYNAPRLSPRTYREDAFTGQSKITSIYFAVCETEPVPAHFKGCNFLGSIRFNENHSNTTSCYRSHGGQLYYDETYHTPYAPAGTYTHKYHLTVVPNAYGKDYVADEGNYFDGYFYPILYPEAFENNPELETISFSKNTEIPTGGWCCYPNLREFIVTDSEAAEFTDGVLLTTVPGETTPAATVRSGVGIHQTAVTIPSVMKSDIPVTTIGKRAFEFGNIDELTFPETITEIGLEAFKDFTGSIIINGSENIQKSAFTNMSGSISVRGIPGDSFLACLENVSTSNVVIKCSPRWFDTIRKYWNGQIVSDRDVWIEQDGVQPQAARFTVKTRNPETITITNVSCNGQTLEHATGVYTVENINSTIAVDITYQTESTEKAVREYVTVLYLGSKDYPFTSIDASITDNAEEGIVCVVNLGDNEIPSDIEYGIEIDNLKYPASNGTVRVPKLLPRNKYYISVYVDYDCQAWKSSLDWLGIKLNEKTDYMKNLRVSYSATQSTISITGAYGTNYNLLYDEALYDKTPFSKNSPKTITNLRPNTDNTINVVLKSGDQVRSYELTGRTNDLYTSLSLSEVSPTSLHAKRHIDTGDTELISAKWNYSDAADDEIDVCGIPVNASEYGFTVEVSYAPGKTHSKTVTKTLNRDRLTITTLDPKVVAENKAIVCASTNASDKESGIGFQWIKTDAPSTLKPSEGFGVIYDGHVEGFINNLQSTSYYNVRAIYKDALGNYTYGSWVTFDPSDFSYFEPTVHTYDVTAITHASARAQGYAMPGTDEIISQGFEYWVENSPSDTKKQMAVGQNEKQTIAASGLLMSAIIKNLKPSTEYCIRSFVTTSASTFYGETMTFVTNDNAGITEIVTTDDTVALRFYDINGRMHSHPVQGLNIVVFSDGTTKKIYIR